MDKIQHAEKKMVLSLFIMWNLWNVALVLKVFTKNVAWKNEGLSFILLMNKTLKPVTRFYPNAKFLRFPTGWSPYLDSRCLGGREKFHFKELFLSETILISHITVTKLILVNRYLNRSLYKFCLSYVSFVVPMIFRLIDWQLNKQH